MTSGAAFSIHPDVAHAARQLLLPTRKSTGANHPTHLPPNAEDDLTAAVLAAALSDGTTGDIEFR